MLRGNHLLHEFQRFVLRADNWAAILVTPIIANFSNSHLIELLAIVVGVDVTKELTQLALSVVIEAVCRLVRVLLC